MERHPGGGAQEIERQPRESATEPEEPCPDRPRREVRGPPLPGGPGEADAEQESAAEIVNSLEAQYRAALARMQTAAFA